MPLDQIEIPGCYPDVVGDITMAHTDYYHEHLGSGAID